MVQSTINYYEDNKQLRKNKMSIEDRASDFLKEGENIYIIIKLLETRSQYISGLITKYKLDDEEKRRKMLKSNDFIKAEKYYETHTGVIEIKNNKGGLQKIFFPLMKKTKYLSASTKEIFEDRVNRATLNEKLFGLLRSQSNFIEEMELFLNCRRRGIRFNLTIFSYIRDVNLILAILTNIFILASPQSGDNQKTT